MERWYAPFSFGCGAGSRTWPRRLCYLFLQFLGVSDYIIPANHYVSNEGGVRRIVSTDFLRQLAEVASVLP